MPGSTSDPASRRREPFERRLEPGGDPYPVYRSYREQDPVHRGKAAHPLFPEHWYLFRHEDVSFVLKDPRFGRDWRSVVASPSAPALPDGPLADLVAMVRRWMLFVDPPQHTRLRGRVNHAFRPRTSARLEPYVREQASALLREAGGRFDGMRDYALPLTVAAIAELLGVPEESRQLMRRTTSRLQPVFGGDSTAASLTPAAEAAAELAEAFGSLLEARRRSPRDDLLSELAPACGERGSEAWNETIATAIFLLGAGFVTTVHGIGNGVYLLLRHPDQLRILRDEPGLLPGAVEELLRFESPVQRAPRFPLEDVEVGGVRLARGATVTAVIGAANRDPAVFDDPERLDVRRDARRHVAFGGGIHSCLGAPLARLEIRVALEVLLRRLPDLALDPGAEPAWSPGITRGLDALPLASRT